MPHLVHGGPGRAGGGEELGGIRSVHHHLQRVAVQGSPDTLSALTAAFLPGATRREGGPHPFPKPFDDLALGDTLVTESRTMTVEDIERFADLTGDHFYAHTDEEAAAKSPIFGGRVAHGYFVIAAAAGLFVWPDPGPVLANYGIDRLRFTTPVKPGDEIHVVFTCKEKAPRPGAGYGEGPCAKPVVARLAGLRCPTVAAVQGAALGAGLGLALACDLLVVAEGAKIGSPFAAIGAVLDSGSHLFLCSRIGPTRTLELVYTGRFLTGVEAVEWGIATSVHPDDELLDAARSLTATIAAGPTATFLRSKD